LKRNTLELIIRQTVLLLCLWTLAASNATAQIWTVLAGDPKGDAADPSLADVAQLSYRYDKEQDLLWFRITVYGQLNQQAIGVNLAIDTGTDDSQKTSWWGANKTFRFDRLLTAWVTRQGERYQGTMGIADLSGIKTRQFNNLSQNNLQIQVEGDSVIIGVKRTEITDKLKMNLIAATGSNEQWNDDVPNNGSATLDLAAARSTRGLREIDLSRNNLEFPAGYQTLPPNRPPVITRQGHGKQAIVLVPGMYSGSGSFAGFIAANESRYRIYELTPPGIGGTPARAMAAAALGVSELTWTRLLERDILNLIQREKLARPLIIAERQPASVAVIALARRHPEMVGGVVLTGTNLLQFFPSPKDPTGRTAATFAQRIAAIEEGLVAKWFKYVTPQTWLSNDYPPEWYSREAGQAERAWRESEATPLEVKIRYTCEFWLSDITEDFKQLQVPVLVLVPGFDEKFLADPGNNFLKTAFVKAWDSGAIKQPNAQVVKIPGGRLLLLENDSELANKAVADFMQRLTGIRN